MEKVEILIFRTNINTRKSLKSLARVFQNISGIEDWSVDTEDVDRVLRVEAKRGLPERDVISVVRKAGYYCEVLPD